MKVVLAAAGLLFLLLLLAVLYAFRRLKRWASSKQTNELLESFDAGLAIPMRDCDTRRCAKGDSAGVVRR